MTTLIMGQNSKNEDLHINDNETPLDKRSLLKLNFIDNALNSGWSVKKQDNCYIFSKKHENRREVFSDEYLEKFIVENNTYQP
jgi:hypothetical protein